MTLRPAAPEDFAIFREIGDPSGRVELFRLAPDRAGGAGAMPSSPTSCALPSAT